jgi:YD repeat-containing protein
MAVVVSELSRIGWEEIPKAPKPYQRKQLVGMRAVLQYERFMLGVSIFKRKRIHAQVVEAGGRVRWFRWDGLRRISSTSDIAVDRLINRFLGDDDE